MRLMPLNSICNVVMFDSVTRLCPSIPMPDFDGRMASICRSFSRDFTMKNTSPVPYALSPTQAPISPPGIDLPSHYHTPQPPSPPLQPSSPQPQPPSPPPQPPSPPPNLLPHHCRRRHLLHPLLPLHLLLPHRLPLHCPHHPHHPSPHHLWPRRQMPLRHPSPHHLWPRRQLPLRHPS